VDILSRSGDIRDQSLKSSKIDRNFACFWPPIFWGDRPPNLWSQFIKFSQIPTIWQSFRAIVRGSSEHPWRNKKKTSAAEYKPVRNSGSGRPNNFRASGSIRTGLFPVDVPRGRGDNVCTIFTRPAPRNLWRPKDVQNLARFLTTFDFDHEYLRYGSTYRKSEELLKI